MQLIALSLLAASQLASAQFTQVFGDSTQVIGPTGADVTIGNLPTSGIESNVNSIISSARSAATSFSLIGSPISGQGAVYHTEVRGGQTYVTDVVSGSTFIANPSTTIGVNPTGGAGAAITSAPSRTSAGAQSNSMSASSSTSSGAANKFDLQAAQVIGGIAVGAFALL